MKKALSYRSGAATSFPRLPHGRRCKRAPRPHSACVGKLDARQLTACEAPQRAFPKPLHQVSLPRPSSWSVNGHQALGVQQTRSLWCTHRDRVALCAGGAAPLPPLREDAPLAAATERGGRMKGRSGEGVGVRASRTRRAMSTSGTHVRF